MTLDAVALDVVTLNAATLNAATLDAVAPFAEQARRRSGTMPG
ncbi:hypothetical protein [Janibacter sp. G1551]